MSHQPFILGVNYWPRRKAMYWWRSFDAAEVREEFTVIKSIGMSLVRIFLLWEDWQPTPDSVDPDALGNLGTVCDIAAGLGLKLDITFFTGHMSGPSWAPSWMLLPGEPMLPGVRQVVSGGKVVNCGHLNPYTDAVALAAEELLLRTVVARYHGHPAVGMWNLGNEPDLFARPPSPAAGRAWARRMVAAIRAIDQATPITCGLHVPDLTEDLGLRANDIFAEVDVPAIHGYPMYADWSAGPLDPQFVPFLCALTSALCGKPTLMEEFGGCTEAPGRPSSVWKWAAYGKPRQQFMAAEEALAEYLAQVLPNLVEVGATGAMLWCYADYAPELWDRPPCDEAQHERFFGLVRPDGTLKPHADVIRQFAATGPSIQPARRSVALGMTPEQFYERPYEHTTRLYQAFLAGGA